MQLEEEGMSNLGFGMIQTLREIGNFNIMESGGRGLNVGLI